MPYDNKKEYLLNLNDNLYNQTKQYQKKYGFKIGIGEHDTHNNESDAFKHTFGAAQIALALSNLSSITIGNLHEIDGNLFHGQPKMEENMDKWNNFQGREIAREIKQIPNWKNLSEDKLNDIIATKVMSRMNRGRLITTPDDKRKYTGFASNIENVSDSSTLDDKSLGKPNLNENNNEIFEQNTIQNQSFIQQSNESIKQFITNYFIQKIKKQNEIPILGTGEGILKPEKQRKWVYSENPLPQFISNQELSTSDILNNFLKKQEIYSLPVFEDNTLKNLKYKYNYLSEKFPNIEDFISKADYYNSQNWQLLI